MTIYRSDKVLFHPDRIHALCQGVQPIPLQVQISISDLCNQGCRTCAYRMEGYSSNALFVDRDSSGRVVNANPVRWILREKLEAILDDCQKLGVKAIQITGGGEPTLHPEYSEVFDGIVRRGLDLGVVTNGVLLTNPHAIEALTRPGVETWIRVSLDAGTAKTYTHFRRCHPDHWGRVWQTIRTLVAARNYLRNSPLTIGVGFVVNAENYREVPDATRLARDAGVDNIRLSGVFQPHGADYFAPFLSEAIDSCAAAMSLQTPTFSVVNLFPDRLADLERGRPAESFCGYQHLCTFLGADLTVYRCCVFAYNPRGMVGSLRAQTFADLWTSPAKRENFAQFDARDCTHCQHHAKNQAIRDAMAAARHRNFV